MPRNSGMARSAMAKQWHFVKRWPLSVNSITAQLIKQVQPANVVNFAHGAGISSPLEAVPALCLGVNDVSLYELVEHIQHLLTKVFLPNRSISHIEDKNG